MPTACKITFENPQNVFYSGEMLIGLVQLSLTKRKTIRGIYIDISGESRTYWSKDASQYTADRKYLHRRTYLLGGINDIIELVPGSYNYAFDCYLPRYLPTSFEGNHGLIRYTVKCTIEVRVWSNFVVTEPFTVIRELDLNLDPLIRQPLGLAKKKYSLLFSFCGASPMIMEAHLPVRGFTPGQTISLYIKVNSQLWPKISLFTVKLIKQIKYSVFNHHKEEEHTVKKTYARNETQKEYIPVNISVPSVPPSNLPTSRNIIRVNYLIRIVGSATFGVSDPVLELPITIGTKPIQIVAQQQSIPTVRVTTPILYHAANQLVLQQPSALPISSHGVSTEGGQISPMHQIAPVFQDNPPKYEDDLPTYEEAKQLFHSDEFRFRPKYPTYKDTANYYDLIH